MVTIKEMSTRQEIMQFIKFAWLCYPSDPNWVPPLIGDTFSLLDKKHSPFFEKAEAIYYMAYDQGRPVGRITAHINHLHNESHNTREGFFGFYECLEHPEASLALLKAAEDWCRSKGMTKIIGPENFTIYDELGFMIKGWDADPATPVILETYTPKYYLQHMETAGYKKEIDWIAFKVKQDFPIKPVFLNIKDRLIRRRGLTLRPFNFKKIEQEMMLVKEIFRTAWEENWGHYPMTDRQFFKSAEALKAIANPKLCFMVEDQGKPVGCSITLPDLNPYVKKMNGRLFPFGIFHLLAGKKKAVGLRMFLMGVMPEYQKIGVDIALVVETFIEGRKVGIQWAECSLIVETNHRMIEPILKWGGDPYKIYRLFNKTL